MYTRLTYSVLQTTLKRKTTFFMLMISFLLMIYQTLKFKMNPTFSSQLKNRTRMNLRRRREGEERKLRLS